jgi:outer membrane lipoprotein-sorting protein
VVRLTPETSEADYELLTLTVDRESLAITGLSTEDVQGGRSSYRFTNLVENRGVPDSSFDFEMPENAHVIRQDSPH